MKKIIMAALPLFLCLLLLVDARAAKNSKEYIVDEGDVLKITVYEHADLETTVRVSGQGTISFPLLNQVKVVGLTTPQISDRLAALLADGYIINPQVNVFVADFRAQSIFVSGEVGKPGAFQYEPDMTLIKVISLAEGFKENAGKDGVSITREIGDKKIVIKNAAMDEPVEPGDVVVVPEGLLQDVFVTGQVEKPGVYQFEPGLTLIKAITMAGGFTDIANKSKVSITRRIETGGEIELDRVNMGDQLQAGDVIIVPESFF